MYYVLYQCGVSVTDGIKIVCLGDHRKFASDVSHLSLELLIKKAQANYPEQGACTYM